MWKDGLLMQIMGIFNYRVDLYMRQNLTKSRRSLCAQLSLGTSPLVTETYNCFPDEKKLFVV